MAGRVNAVYANRRRTGLAAGEYVAVRKPENDNPPDAMKTPGELREDALAKLDANAREWGEAYAYTQNGKKWHVTRMPPLNRDKQREIWVKYKRDDAYKVKG